MLSDNIRENILAAREKRAFLRQQCAVAGSGAMSVSLNIPGYPKCTPLFSAFFDQILTEVQRFFCAQRVRLDSKREICLDDEAGHFYLVPLQQGASLPLIKSLGEIFEETHPLGRVIDIDVTDQYAQPISSHKCKPCFLCEQPAIVCMREQTHTYQELRAAIALRVTNYLEQQRQTRICKQLAAIAAKAVLYEISLSPKPGLVDRWNQGAHQDMDYVTFLGSSAAIMVYFEELAVAGYIFREQDASRALPAIRTIGLKMEAAMFHTTGGVNTHKGLIFLLGLSLFTAAVLLAQHGAFQRTRCRQLIAQICQNLVQHELVSDVNAEQTHGVQCFREYGSLYGGAREEAEKGFPAVFEHGLPEFTSQLVSASERIAAEQMNEALIHTLLRLISVVSDTNILYRKNLQTLHEVQQQAQCVLNTQNQQEKAARYTALIDYCRRQGISPGGSADLLAVTVFFYFVEAAFSNQATAVSSKFH